MIETLLSPKEIKSSIGETISTNELFRDIRRGEWDSEKIFRIIETLEQSIAERRSAGDFKLDPDCASILAILSVMFYSKDKFGHDRESKEYESMEQLFGRLMAALGM